MAKKWIAGAIKHPGALHKQLGISQSKTIPAGRLAAATSKGGTLGRRARLAQTLKGFHKGGMASLDVFTPSAKKVLEGTECPIGAKPKGA